MKRGVLAIIGLLVLVPLAHAFDVTVTPDNIYAEVQAGGYVSELVEIHADRPVQVLAKASPSIIGLLQLTRHNDTAIIVHFLPPITSPQVEAKGQLVLDVIGEDPTISADLQHATIPLNVTVIVAGKAPAPAVVNLASEDTIRVLPLSSDSVTMVALIVAGVVALNVVLRSTKKKRRR
jgi:hypothetical protein